MIYQVTIAEAVKPIMKLIKEKKEVFDISEDKLLEYLNRSVSGDDAILLVDEKDKDVRGFLFASIEEWDGQDVVFIQACVSEPHQKNTVFEFIAKLKVWGRKKGLNKMVFVTERNPQPYERKYKFKLNGYILTQDIGGK